MSEQQRDSEAFEDALLEFMRRASMMPMLPMMPRDVFLAGYEAGQEAESQAAAAAEPEPSDENILTIDKRDLFDRVRYAIKDALTTDESDDEAGLWSDAHYRAVSCLKPIVNHTPTVAADPVATIHVDGSFVHVEWHRTMPNECHMPVFATPAAADEKTTRPAHDSFDVYDQFTTVAAAEVSLDQIAEASARHSRAIAIGCSHQEATRRAVTYILALRKGDKP